MVLRRLAPAFVDTPIGDTFLEAYWSGSAPADWPRRETLFQLYPLLNHLLLFGGGYREAVERAVARLEAYQD